MLPSSGRPLRVPEGESLQLLLERMSPAPCSDGNMVSDGHTSGWEPPLPLTAPAILPPPRGERSRRAPYGQVTDRAPKEALTLGFGSLHTRSPRGNRGKSAAGGLRRLVQSPSRPAGPSEVVGEFGKGWFRDGEGTRSNRGESTWRTNGAAVDAAPAESIGNAAMPWTSRPRLSSRA